MQNVSAINVGEEEILFKMYSSAINSFTISVDNIRKKNHHYGCGVKSEMKEYFYENSTKNENNFFIFCLAMTTLQNR
jgi:hypothetical protein